mmetsp:Transcript_92245/g.246645  ORF Transcript_92245/g.246645 Transcript_92245/m.246645 type:complete len:211 (-) Transcript_92245:76-708(-)
MKIRPKNRAEMLVMLAVDPIQTGVVQRSVTGIEAEVNDDSHDGQFANKCEGRKCQLAKAVVVRIARHSLHSCCKSRCLDHLNRCVAAQISTQPLPPCRGGPPLFAEPRNVPIHDLIEKPLRHQHGRDKNEATQHHDDKRSHCPPRGGRRCQAHCQGCDGQQGTILENPGNQRVLNIFGSLITSFVAQHKRSSSDGKRQCCSWLFVGQRGE